MLRSLSRAPPLQPNRRIRCSYSSRRVHGRPLGTGLCDNSSSDDTLPYRLNTLQQYGIHPFTHTTRRQTLDLHHRCLATCSSSISRRRFSSVFVSRHNQSLNVTSDTIVEYCQNHGISTFDARHTHSHVVLRECPFCTKPTNDKADNLYKCHILIGGGAFFCHRCGTGGSWYDFKSLLGGYKVDKGTIRTFPNTASGYRGGYQASTQPQRSNRDGGYGEGPPLSSGGGSPSSTGGAGGSGAGHYYGRDGTGNNQTTRSNNKRQAAPSNNVDSVPCLPLPKPRLSGIYSSDLLDPQTDGRGNRVLDYLMNERGLDRKTLRKFGVGRAVYHFPSDLGGYVGAECVTFPWIMRTSDVQSQEALRGATFVPPDELDNVESRQKAEPPKSSSARGEKEAPSNADTEKPTGKFITRRIKARAVDHKAWQRLDPPGGGWGLFGLHTVPDDCTEIVLTEGEYDAMAVSQATGIPAVSLPNGCRSLPIEVLPLLERFEKIYLWMDNDGPGQEGAEKFVKKLGLNRTYIVYSPEAKDANDALLKGLDMNEFIRNASLMPHERIVTFQDLRNDVLHELLHPEVYAGVPISSLPKFTQIIKGFRRGEMTVLTGPTGSGKTTFLGQVSLDLAESGINVLWGSFEIKNTRLLHKLLKQFARENLPLATDPNAIENLNALADRFESLPLYFMKFHGGSDVDEVLDAMEYAVYVNDVEHIVLDNMQFMISRKTHKTSFDKFEVQDMAIEKFRQFATEHNVHVTLVVHPRKEDESSKLSISSFYGSAKATQEADTVIILQNDNPRRKYIDVRKNRFDGTLGTCPLYFQSSSGRYVDYEQNQGLNSTSRYFTSEALDTASSSTKRNTVSPPETIPSSRSDDNFDEDLEDLRINDHFTYSPLNGPIKRPPQSK